MTQASPPAGWYADPAGASNLRYWDGDQWTEHLTPAPALAPSAVPPSVPSSTPVPVATSTGSGAVVAVVLSGIGLGVVGAPLGLGAARNSALGQASKPKLGIAAVWVASGVMLLPSILFGLINLVNGGPASGGEVGGGEQWTGAILAIIWSIVTPLAGLVACIAIPVQLSRLNTANVRSATPLPNGLMTQAWIAGILYLVVAAACSIYAIIGWVRFWQTAVDFFT